MNQLPTRRPPPPPSRHDDNPELARAQERLEEERASNLKLQLELRALQDEFRKQKAMQVVVTSAPEEKAPPSSHSPAFEGSFKIKNWKDFAKSFVWTVGALAGVAIGVWNKYEKAAVPQVVQVDQKVDNVKESTTPKNTGPDSTDTMADVVEKQGQKIELLEAQRCAEHWWWAEVLGKLDPPIIVEVKDCENAHDSVGIHSGPALGARGKLQIVVDKPLPHVQKIDQKR